MLKEPRDTPILQIINYEIGEDIFFTIPHDLLHRHAEEDVSSGAYDPLSNIMYLSAYPEPLPRDLEALREDMIIHTILHETDHWAQFLFVDYKDSCNVLKKYNYIKGDFDAEIPFVEKTNFFKSTYWHLRELGYISEMEKRVKTRKIKTINFNLPLGIMLLITSLLYLGGSFTWYSYYAIGAGIFFILSIKHLRKCFDVKEEKYIDDLTYWYPKCLNNDTSLSSVVKTLKADEMLVDGIVRPCCFGYMPGFSDSCDQCTCYKECEDKSIADTPNDEEMKAIIAEQERIEDYGFDHPWEM